MKNETQNTEITPPELRWASSVHWFGGTSPQLRTRLVGSLLFAIIASYSSRAEAQTDRTSQPPVLSAQICALATVDPKIWLNYDRETDRQLTQFFRVN